ncbi:MAG: NAD(P)H-quinone oxidoreductase [Oleiphilaceae bacterium]|nr:NAD(P)H-quinone oxidoreductase [Oleiphilaceae bacterium]
MKAIAVTDDGLSWQPHPDLPGPDEDEVRIRVAWAGVNRADLMQKAGQYPPPPGASDILGLEISGTIAEVGANVTHFKAGDPVCALLTGGGYASQVVVAAAQVLPIPQGLDLKQAAALPEVFATAWLNLYMEAALVPGQRVLLHAAASGLGTAVIQLARAMGNPVFATAGSDDKLALCRRLGADATWNRHQGSFVDAVKDWGGVDMVLDPVGGSYIGEDQKVLEPGGRIVLIGLMGGLKAEVDLGLMLVKRQRLIGSTLRAQPVAVKGEILDALYEVVWPKLSSGEISPVIDQAWPVVEADKALAYVQNNSNAGKVLLQMPSST